MVVKYTLKTPIAWGEQETITELTVRRPTAGDFRGIELKRNVEVSFDDKLTLASRTTGTEKAKLERMDVADMTEVYKIISNFISPSPQIGNAPSDCLPDTPFTSISTE